MENAKDKNPNDLAAHFYEYYEKNVYFNMIFN